MQAAEQPSVEALLSAFKTIDPAERRKHASVLNYWLSIRGDKEFPPLHDLDPLEISDAGPNSVLLELISGGHDAEVRHIGEALRGEGRPDRIIDAETPSILASIAKKLPIVAISRDFLAFEDEFATLEKSTRCWVTLLPLSAGGAWVDYVYGLVSLEVVTDADAKAAKSAPKKTKVAEPVAEELVEVPEPEAPLAEPDEQPDDDPAPTEEVADTDEIAPVEPVEELELPSDAAVAPDEPRSYSPEADVEPEPVDGEPDDASAKGRPGFSKLLDNLAGLTGFYGHGYKVDSVSPPAGPLDDEPVDQAASEPAPMVDEAPIELEEIAEQAAADPVEEPEPAVETDADAPVAEQPADNPTPGLEGPLQTKLSDVRAKADEARQAKLRANAALYEGLSAAYDFALDAENAPEEYLRLVEAEGLKIQLRSPMRPVVKLAFNGMCDDSTIRQLEAVLAWALDNELPRGSLAEQIEAAGGIAPILSGDVKAAA
ncbi:MAG: hypothetical protein ACJ8E3_03025 [Sphingomicrobium sp.]